MTRLDHSPLDRSPGDRVARAVPVAGLRITPRLQLRDAEPSHVQCLRGVLEQVPPILVDETSMEVVDGVHRVHAARAAGHSHIEAVMISGSDLQLLLAGIASNSRHGLPLSLAQRRYSARRLLELDDARSDRWIAEIVGLSAAAVASLRSSTVQTQQLNASCPFENGSSSRLGKDGRVRPLSAAAGKQMAAELFSDRPDRPIREVAQEAHISVGTAHAVKKALLHDSGPGTAEQDPLRTPAAGCHADVARRAPAPSPAQAVLSRMARDPSVVQSEGGRLAFRRLQALRIDAVTAHAIVQTLPPHYLDDAMHLINDSLGGWSVLVAALAARRAAEE